MRRVSQRIGREMRDYSDLYSWSIENIEEFWESIWHEAKITHSSKYHSVLSSRRMPGAQWFDGATLNFARNLLRYRDDRPAIIHWRESGTPIRYTYRELYRSVAACSKGLARLGVRSGDRIAANLPNIPEAVIAMLAATSQGALWSSCSPDFGAQGVIDRFSQISPKLLITVDRYVYQGKSVSCLEAAQEIAARIPSIEKIIVISPYPTPVPSRDDNLLTWDDLLSQAVDEIDFAELPFDHPVYIMYSSGTTGAPKCIVHGAGGTLLQHYKELVLHTDVKRSDIVCYYTTCGWMMWNWLVSSLSIGATVFLYDGSPAYPNIEILWRAIEQERISVFGTSPKYLSACQRSGLIPRDQFDLSSLRTVLSTGSPLSDENFAWVYGNVKQDLQLSSISGGTDIISCFMLGNPLLPVFSGEIQCRGLGMKVEAFDQEGSSLMNQTGELVCTAPFPSMPIGFWNDPDGTRYRKAYFDIYPGVWHHGDYIRITERGTVVVYGRSDATLNPGGVRIGTAEIYNPVEALPEIVDSIAVGQRWNNDIRIILFVVLAEGVELTIELKTKIKNAIRAHSTPRHIPSLILPVQEVPRTLNGKKVEIAVTQIIHGENVPNRDALQKPVLLDQFVNIPELRRN